MNLIFNKIFNMLWKETKETAFPPSIQQLGFHAVNRMKKSMTIMITTGREDGGIKASLGLATAMLSLDAGFSVIVFLVGNGVVWGLKETLECVNIGLPPMKDIIKKVLDLKGKLWVCSVCHNSCGLGAPLHKGAEIANLADLLPHFTQGPQLVF